MAICKQEGAMGGKDRGLFEMLFRCVPGEVIRNHGICQSVADTAPRNLLNRNTGCYLLDRNIRSLFINVSGYAARRQAGNEQ
jgi:hypothetical protein